MVTNITNNTNIANLWCENTADGQEHNGTTSGVQPTIEGPKSPQD